ncbi:MAG TPA: hypothetical protein VI756_14950, partial [Blastocatellia bacterium]
MADDDGSLNLSGEISIDTSSAEANLEALQEQIDVVESLMADFGSSASGGIDTLTAALAEVPGSFTGLDTAVETAQAAVDAMVSQAAGQISQLGAVSAETGAEIQASLPAAFAGVGEAAQEGAAQVEASMSAMVESATAASGAMQSEFAAAAEDAEPLSAAFIRVGESIADIATGIGLVAQEMGVSFEEMGAEAQENAELNQEIALTVQSVYEDVAAGIPVTFGEAFDSVNAVWKNWQIEAEASFESVSAAAQQTAASIEEIGTAVGPLTELDAAAQTTAANLNEIGAAS